MDDERGAATEEVAMIEAEGEREESSVDKVDRVQEEADATRDKVKHIEKSSQLFLEKMM